jgi:hypothetical protein
MRDLSLEQVMVMYWIYNIRTFCGLRIVSFTGFFLVSNARSSNVLFERRWAPFAAHFEMSSPLRNEVQKFNMNCFHQTGWPRRKSL